MSPIRMGITRYASVAGAMVRWRVAFLVFVALTMSCAGAREPMAPTGPEDSPDYAVYDAVLDGLFPPTASNAVPPRFVIIDSTATWGAEIVGSEYVAKQFGTLLAPHLLAAREDFVRRSGIAVPLHAESFRARGRIEVVSRADLAAITSRDTTLHEPYWGPFYARFPGVRGIISFSQPGYDSTRTHALLFYSHGCGMLCADQGYVLIERRAEGWVVMRRVVTLVS